MLAESRVLEDPFFCWYCHDLLFLSSLPSPVCFPCTLETERGNSELSTKYSFHSVTHSADKSVDATVHYTRANLCKFIQRFHSNACSFSSFLPPLRLFGNSGACSACGQSIPASELVMRAQGNVYHLKVNWTHQVLNRPKSQQECCTQFMSPICS